MVIAVLGFYNIGDPEDTLIHRYRRFCLISQGMGSPYRTCNAVTHRVFSSRQKQARKEKDVERNVTGGKKSASGGEER